jgi:DNA-binding ferritin-like protein
MLLQANTASKNINTEELSERISNIETTVLLLLKAINSNDMSKKEQIAKEREKLERLTAREKELEEKLEKSSKITQ